jgi:hypothetical protein
MCRIEILVEASLVLAFLALSNPSQRGKCNRLSRFSAYTRFERTDVRNLSVSSRPVFLRPYPMKINSIAQACGTKVQLSRLPYDEAVSVEGRSIRIPVGSARQISLGANVDSEYSREPRLPFVQGV